MGWDWQRRLTVWTRQTCPLPPSCPGALAARGSRHRSSGTLSGPGGARGGDDGTAVGVADQDAGLWTRPRVRSVAATSPTLALSKVIPPLQAEGDEVISA